MGLKRSIRLYLNKLLKKTGYELVLSDSVYEWQRNIDRSLNNTEGFLPEGAEEYLKRDNPRLADLKKRYAEFNQSVTQPVLWKEGHITDEDLAWFRGDNAYVWQLRGQNMDKISYALTATFLTTLDGSGLMQKLEEDELFGNFSFIVDNKIVSRDLLDSVNEIIFITKHLIDKEAAKLRILDIGAGYGRLAHRFLEAFPENITYFCTDAVPESTFISEYYLKFRQLDDRATVIPVDEIEQTMDQISIDLAVNIHSFSECSGEAVEWWISLLSNSNVRYLMVVPNAMTHGREELITFDNKDILKILEKFGYTLKVKEPKYDDPVIQKYGINPTFYYLFELNKFREYRNQ